MAALPSITPHDPATPAAIDLAGAHRPGRASSTATPTSTRATSGRASPIPTAHSWARSTPTAKTGLRDGRPTTWRAAWIFRCAAPTRTAPSALRTHLDSVAPQETISWPVFEDMRERWARPHRVAGGLPDSASRPCATRPGSPGWPKRVAAGTAAYSAASPTWCPTSRNCSTGSLRLPSSMGSISTFTSTRPTTSQPRRSGRSPTRPCGTTSRERSSSAIAARSRARPTATFCETLDKRRQGRLCGRLPADVQSLSAGPPLGRHDAALARRDAAARDEGARHCRSRSPPTTRAIRSMPMAISTCWRSTAWRRASCISTIRSPTGRRPSPRRPPKSCAWKGRARSPPAVLRISSSSRARSWTELLSRPESDRIVVRDGSAIDRDAAGLRRTRRSDGCVTWT